MRQTTVAIQLEQQTRGLKPCDQEEIDADILVMRDDDERFAQIERVQHEGYTTWFAGLVAAGFSLRTSAG